MCNLNSKVAIVAGASRGIGRETARLFAGAGACVVAAARNAKALDDVVAEIRKAGGRGLAVPTDVTNKASIERLVDRTISSYGRLDILINCAGGIDRPDYAAFLEMTEEQWDRVLNANLRSTFMLGQRVGRVMKERGGGTIVNVSSRSATVPNPGNAQYCAAKSAVESLTRSMALELGEYGIRVNTVAPGLIPTEGTAIPTSKEELRRLGNQSPLGRFGSVQDAAALMLFLASDSASWISGSTVAINGGSALPNGYLEFIDRLGRRT